MLLTLSDYSFRSALSGAKPKMSLLDLPKVAHEELGLNGLVLHTNNLTGWDLNKLEQFRDRADKAAAPCLLLVESDPQRLGDSDPALSAAAEERMGRVLQVAHRLGCSAVAMSLRDPGASGSLDAVATAVKRVVQRSERLELNLLISPVAGITGTPEKLTGLIRKVGGFRIGAYPDFEAASAGGIVGTANDYLRALTPYASVVCASFSSFDASGKHKGFDFESCVKSVESVGFDQTITLECRGSGDPREAIARAKSLFEALNVTEEEAAEDDDAEE